MRIVVLAAGVGSRLRPLTDSRPKCLVEVGGSAILGRLLNQAGALRCLTEAVVVTGFRQEDVADYLARRPDAASLPLRLVHNDLYDRTNNLYSLWCAREWLRDGFLLVDGDLVLGPDILPCLAAQGGSALAIDTRIKLDAEAMKCRLDAEGRVVELSKDIPPDAAAGESIGLARIDPADAAGLVSHLEEIVAAGGVNEYYERAFQGFLAAGWDFRVYDIHGMPWVEVDDMSDLDRATRLFCLPHVT